MINGVTGMEEIGGGAEVVGKVGILSNRSVFDARPNLGKEEEMERLYTS